MYVKRIAKQILCFLVTLLALSGCGLKLDGDYTSGTVPHSYSMNGVKLIDSSIGAGEDASTMLQDHYLIQENRRLLLRFESFSSHINDVNVAYGNKVEVEITLTEAPADIDLTSFQLCPITTQWMMLATWIIPNPYQKNHTWKNAGGDYDRALCANPTLKTGTSVARFDVTDWFVDMARGRDLNYGFVLIAKKPIHVKGELQTHDSPKILFKK